MTASLLSGSWEKYCRALLLGTSQDLRGCYYGAADMANHESSIADRVTGITPPNPSGAFKVIQKLEDWGYHVVDDDSDDELNQLLVAISYADVESQYQAIRITVPSISQRVVDVFIYFDMGTAAGNTLAITQAWNFRRDERPQHEKLALRDIILAFWVFNLGRAAHDLSAIIYYSVIEEVLRHELFQLVYQMMDEDILAHLALNRETESSREKEAFDLLLKRAPFCI